MSLILTAGYAFWRAAPDVRAHYPRLNENLRADVCVVGAGFTGLTTAYLLQRAGFSVVVLDAMEIGNGETSRSTAHLTAVLDPRYYELEQRFGEDKAALISDSHRTAMRLIQQLIAEEKIECACYPVPGYMIAGDEQREEMDRELAAAQRAGMKCKKLSQIDIGPFSWQSGCLQFPDQAIFHPAQYLTQLAAILADRGAVIRTGNPVLDVKGGDHPIVTVADGFTVSAKSLVIATHTPINDKLKMHTKQAAYRSYTLGMQVPKDIYKSFLLWDMVDPYHYVRLFSGESYDLLIAGGEDHKTGQANDGPQRYQAIEEWTRARFPGTGAVLHRWSGQIINSLDGIAFIGRNPGEKNVYIATGFSGNGMSYGMIAASLIRDLITGQDNPLREVYDPERKMLGALPDYIRENSNALGHMIADWAAPAEAQKESEISLDEGAILRDGLHKVAAYRDGSGVLHRRSANCTHFGCILQWNGTERSWDCPVDGSRFSPDGVVLHGPATRPLPRLDELAEIGDNEQRVPLQESPPIDPAIPT